MAGEDLDDGGSARPPPPASPLLRLSTSAKQGTNRAGHVAVIARLRDPRGSADFDQTESIAVRVLERDDALALTEVQWVVELRDADVFYSFEFAREILDAKYGNDRSSNSRCRFPYREVDARSRPLEMRTKSPMLMDLEWKPHDLPIELGEALRFLAVEGDRR